MYDGEIRAGEEVLDWIVGESSGDHTIGKINSLRTAVSSVTY